MRIERFHVYSMDIRPCTGCLGCSDGKGCVIRDDMIPVYDALTRGSFITFSFPLYFSSMPGPLKNLIDRCNLLWMRRRLGLYPSSGQKGLVIATAGSVYRDMFNPSLTVISHLMNSLGGGLDRENSLLMPGMDSADGKAAYDARLSDAAECARRAGSFLSGDIKKV